MLSDKKHQWHIGYVAVIFGLIYWPLESLVHTYVFHEGTLLQQLLEPDPNELWMRLIIISLFLGYGFYAEKLIIQQTKLAKKIHQQKEEMKLTVDCAFDALISVNQIGEIIDCNHKAISMFGWSKDELLGSDFLERLLPAQNWHDSFEKLFEKEKGEPHHVIELQIQQKDKQLRPVEVGIVSIHKDEGIILNAFMRDISERKDLEQRLYLADKVMQGALESIIITDQSNAILAVNPAFTVTTGYTEEEVIGLTPRILQSGRQDKAFYGELWSILAETGKWQGEIWNKRKDGDQYLEWLNISAVKDEKDKTTHYVGTFQDITKQKENENRLRFLSHHDQLTGLPNRVLFFDRLQQSIAAASRRNKMLALLFVDLDGFKAVNDELGHHAGDVVLKQVSTRLQETVRAMDTIARVGGDEFTGILAEVGSADDAAVVANKIIIAIAASFEVDGKQVNIGASVGISIYPRDSKEQDELIRQADCAMYAAKKSGRNCYFFYDEKID